MRELTIQRGKCFPGCLAKAHVYIEDTEARELLISDVPCRKLGTLKNGQSGTYTIDDRAARVFVIPDRASRNYANDCYPLETGSEPVILTGKYVLTTGAAVFHFDGITDEAILADRKKRNRKATGIIWACAIGGAILGVLFSRTFLTPGGNDPKAFTCQDMSITLTEDFREADYQGFTKCYETRYATVFALEEPFSLAPGLESYTLEEYGDLVFRANGLTGTTLKNEQGVTYFDYTTDVEGETYYYFVTLHKEDDAFWLVQFVTPVTNQASIADEFFQWAGSIAFD